MARTRRRRRRVRRPGASVQELTSGSRPIGGVGTSTAAFIGSVSSVPRRHPVLTGVAVVGLLVGAAAVAGSAMRRTASSLG